MPSSYDDEEDKRRQEAAQTLVEELAQSTTDELPSKLRVALERGWEKKLPALLTDFKTSKEAEIERLCQRHYNGYLDSVQQLVYMRDDCREVRTAMVDLNSKLQTRGAAVVQAARRQRTLQLAQQQLQQQAATIRNCRALVALAQRAASQVAAKRYVAAMHSLAAIEAQVCDPLSMPDRATSSATSAAGLASSVNTVSMTQAGSSPAAARSGGHVEPAQLQQEELEEDQELLQQRALAETPLAQSLRAWLPGAQRAALQDTKRGLAEWLAVARPRARRMGATLRSRVLCLEASELAHLLSGPTTPWTDASSSSNNKHHSDSSNKDSLGSSSGSNTETVALLAALSEVEATSREVLAVTTSANTQTAAGAGRDEDKKETATDNSTSTVVADASNTPSDLSAAVAAGNQAMARLRTARVAALEASLGLAAWDNLGHAEPCLRSLLAHAALPRHSWPSSPPVETSAEDQAQAVKKPTATGSATDGSIDENSGKHDGPATTPPASSEVVSLEHSKEGAAAVMAEVRRSLAPLDQAVAVHAARGSKPLAEFRAQYEALRSPHFLPKQLLELHRAQDGPTPPAPRRISQASPEASFSSSSSSSGGRGDGCGGTPDDLSQSAWQEWCGSVAAWPDLLDTLGGFFAMECTLCALTSVPQATFTREDLASLWRDATDELIELLLERFHTFDQKMHAHSLPTLPRPGDRTTSTTSAAATADGMVALQRDPLMGLLLLKECCLGFNASLGSRTYGFSSKPLRRALGQKVLPKFLATQLRAVEVRCARAAALDGHQPWSVSNDTVYAQWVEPLALDRLLVDQSTAEGGHGVTSSSHQNSAGRVEFPVQFSFSAAVPHVGLILHRFLAQSLAFCHGLGPDSALSGGDGDDDDDDDDDDEVNGVNNATGVVGNGNSSGGSNGCKNRGALLRHALAEALFSVDNTLNNLLTNNDSTKADRSSSGGNSSGKGNLDASSHASKRSRLGMASSKKDTNSSSRSGGSNSSSGGNQAVSISLAAQVSLDARAYAALAYQLGALLNHALSSSGWPDARSSDVNGYNSGLSVASNAGADDFNHREDNHHPRNGGGGGARTIANAAKSLQATADRAQDLIFELVRLKCDELLSLDAINWEPTAAPDGPRPEVEDLVAYLQVTFMCLVALPPEANAAVHFASCAYVHSNLRATLLAEGPSSSPTPTNNTSGSNGSSSGSSGAASNPQTPSSSPGCVRVNALALHSLRLDVLCLEAFARDCGLQEASGLEQVFAPLRQLLDALLDRGASHVLGNVPTRRALYPQLDCNDAETVLHKVVGVPAMARLKMMSSGGRSGAAAAELPSLDKKQAAELIKLLQSSGS